MLAILQEARILQKTSKANRTTTKIVKYKIWLLFKLPNNSTYVM